MADRTLIVWVTENPSSLPDLLAPLSKFKSAEILVIDDGSLEPADDYVGALPGIKSIRHESPLGPGGSFLSGYHYARDFNFDYMIILDPDNSGYMADIEHINENLEYGYDIVTCSRILENYDHDAIPREHIETGLKIAAFLNSATNFDITDPFSGTKALRLESLRDMDLSEFSHALYLQLFIQASYFGLGVIEIPSHAGAGFGSEFEEYDDPLGYFLSLIDSEKYLYQKRSAT